MVELIHIKAFDDLAPCSGYLASASIARPIAGCFRFLILIRCFDRIDPEPSQRLDCRSLSSGAQWPPLVASEERAQPKLKSQYFPGSLGSFGSRPSFSRDRSPTDNESGICLAFAVNCVRRAQTKTLDTIFVTATDSPVVPKCRRRLACHVGQIRCTDSPVSRSP